MARAWEHQWVWSARERERGRWASGEGNLGVSLDSLDCLVLDDTLSRGCLTCIHTSDDTGSLVLMSSIIG